MESIKQERSERKAAEAANTTSAPEFCAPPEIVVGGQADAAKVATFVPTKNSLGAATVRLSDDDLHRAACKTLHESDHLVFRSLPSIIRQIIDYKIWKSRLLKFESFGEYALNQTSEGLGIENNQLLWLLRCSLDIDGIHVKEWASVLDEVEKSVKVQAKADGRKIRSFNGNSLETLGKACADQHTAKITYLPSRNRNLDGQLIRLKKASPESYRKVLCGELSVCEGLSKPKRSKLSTVGPQNIWRHKMRELIEKLGPIVKGLKEEGNKNMATMAPSAVAALAALLQKQLNDYADQLDGKRSSFIMPKNLRAEPKKADPTEQAEHGKPVKLDSSTKLVWKDDGSPVNLDGQDRHTFTAKAGRGEYRILPGFSINMRFLGYIVDYVVDREKLAVKDNRRSIEKYLFALDAAKAAAQRDYESLTVKTKHQIKAAAK